MAALGAQETSGLAVCALQLGEQVSCEALPWLLYRVPARGLVGAVQLRTRRVRETQPDVVPLAQVHRTRRRMSSCMSGAFDERRADEHFAAMLSVSTSTVRLASCGPYRSTTRGHVGSSPIHQKLKISALHSLGRLE